MVPKRFQNKLLAWYDDSAEPWPWRTLWQKHRSPYHVWVSEIMLQQTVIKAALPVFTRFIGTFPDLFALAKASEQEVKLVCQGLGYYRRFALLHNAAKILVTRNLNESLDWPSSASSWRELPGVGPYTAAAIASITLNEPVAVVDGNVERVLCRLADLREPVNLARLKPYYTNTAQQLLSENRPGDYNQALMELGQKLCTPNQPKCSQCPVSEFCLSCKRGSQHVAPGPKIKRALQEVDLQLLIISRKDEIAIYRRCEKDMFLKGTLGLLTFSSAARQSSKKQPCKNAKTTKLGTFRHSITNHRIKVEVLLARFNSKWPSPETWVKAIEADKFLISNLDRKALRLYEKHS